jgi:hypothetical protein
VVQNLTQGTDFYGLQDAINASVNGDEVVADPQIYFETIDFIDKAITLRSVSGDPADTIIDGGAAGSVVTCASGETPATVLDGFTITNGLATYGGGMYNQDSSPTVTNGIFSGNTATYGGGMYNENSVQTATNCRFLGNTATNSGGGMYNKNSINTVANCVFMAIMAPAGWSTMVAART